MSRRIDQEYFVWVFSSSYSAASPVPKRSSLQEILSKASTQDKTTLMPVRIANEQIMQVNEVPCLGASRWYNSLGANKNRSKGSFAILQRTADGDRVQEQIAPCLRSLGNTGGKHQAGCGAYKVREYQGEHYYERTLTPLEAERLMGWTEGSTALGLDEEGKDKIISNTQRIKMLGNGIIPNEITEILEGLQLLLEEGLRQKWLQQK